MCFRLFQRRVTEHKEARVYTEKLDQFAFEIYRRRSFLTFLTNTLQRKASRKILQKSTKSFQSFLKQKAFADLTKILMPRINHMKDNMKAMKWYILRLYSVAFRRWKLFRKYTAKMNATSERIRINILLNWKRKFIKNLYIITKKKTIKEDKNHLATDKVSKSQKKKVISALKKNTEKKILLQETLNKWLEKRDGKILERYLKIWLDIYCENVKKRYELANALLKVYKKSIEQGFASIAVYYCKKRKLELGFDAIHEKYIASLLRNKFGIWKNQFNLNRLSAEDLEEY